MPQAGWRAVTRRTLPGAAELREEGIAGETGCDLRAWNCHRVHAVCNCCTSFKRRLLAMVIRASHVPPSLPAARATYAFCQTPVDMLGERVATHATLCTSARLRCLKAFARPKNSVNCFSSSSLESAAFLLLLGGVACCLQRALAPPKGLRAQAWVTP